MGHYPFTLFNGITLFILLLTLGLAWGRLRGPLAANWPLLCYVAIAGYTIGFSGGLNRYAVGAGVICALAIRLGFYPARMRLVELVALGYIVWRCVELILMW